MNSLVSIIVPCYNAEELIKKCADSIMNQTYKNLEIIFINDGSTDNTLDILKTYESDSRVKIITTKNQGASSSRNEGLKVASGEYIAFIDADDYVDSSYIESLIAEMTDEVDIVECGYDRNGEKINCSKKLTYAFDEEYSFLGEKFIAHVWATLYKRKVLITKQGEMLEFFTSLKMGEDTLFNVMALINANKVVRIPSCMYYYTVRENSVSRQKEYYNEYTKIEAFEHIIREVSNTGLVTPLYTVKKRYFFFLKDMYENMQKNKALYKLQLKDIKVRVKKYLKEIRKMNFGKRVYFAFVKISLGWRI